MLRLAHCRWWIASGVVLAVCGAFVTTDAYAVILGNEKEYTLEEGETIEDDVTVSGETIVIDGTIDGDLIAAGKYIEVNGTVTGDVIAAGYGIKITGEVGDDARLGGAAVEVSGTIGDSLHAAGGGGKMKMPFPISGNIPVDEGFLLTDTAKVGGEAAIAGGEVRLEGAIEGEARIAAGDLTLAGTIGDDVEVHCKELATKEGAAIAGALSVKSSNELEIPEGIAESVEFEQIETRASKGASVVEQMITRTIGTLLNIAGFVVLGLFFSRFASKTVARPAQALSKSPFWATLYGLPVLLAFTLVPVATCLLMLLSVLQGPSMPFAVVGMLMSAFVMMWNLSPAITGLWLGRKLAGAPHDDKVPLRLFVLGTSIIAVLGHIPYIGVVVYLVSMLAAIGGIFLACRTRPEAAPVTEAAPQPGPDAAI